jgi:hypothetical protein
MAARVAVDLLMYITSSKFVDGTWNGTAQGFILNWQDKVRQYESILPAKDHFAPTTWLLALMYVCFVLNFTASASLNGDTDWFHTRYLPPSQLSIVGTCVLQAG